MSSIGIQRTQIYLTTTAALYITALLAWQHFHGGVVSHHILHRADLPAISNWWGILLLPILTWFLAGRIPKHEDGLNTKSIIRLVGSLLYGALLSVSYFNGLEKVASLMGPGLLVLALFIPLYRAEYVLGFILSMTFAFGAILPTAFAAVVALLAFIIYRFIRPVPMALFDMVIKKR